MKNLIFLNILRNKKHFLLVFALFTVILTAIIATLNCKTSYFSYLNYITENYFDARRIDALKIGLTYEEMIDEISEIDHVLDVFMYEDYSTALDVENFEQEKIFLDPAGPGYTPIAILGRGIENTNEIICPIKLAKARSTGFDTEYIDMTKYLGEKITVNQNIYYYEIYGQEPVIIDTKYYELEIVGLYDYSAFGDEPYYCYMNKEELGTIVNDTQEVFAENFWPENFVVEDSIEDGVYTWLQIVVDDNKNVEQVEVELEKRGYDYLLGYYIDYDYFARLEIALNIIILISLLFFTIIFNLIINRYIKKRDNDIMILKSIGYNNKQITLSTLLNLIIPFILSFLVSLIINFGLYKILNNYIQTNAQLIGLTIQFYYKQEVWIILFLIVDFIYIYIQTNSKIQKILRRRKINETRSC